MSETSSEKFYVVLMDDSMTDLAIAGLLVQKFGYEPRPFDNYTKLVKFLREEKESVKLILLDNEMPGLTGIDVLKRLKKEAVIKDIPVVMMTGDSAPATVYRAVTCGAVNYLVKPLIPEVFEDKLKKFIPQREPVKSAPKQPTETPCQNRIDLKFPGMVASLGENTMTLRTDYRVGAGAKFVIDTPFLNEVGIRAVPLEVKECVEIPNGFHLRCTLGSMEERDLEMFQKYYRALIRAGAAVPVAG